MKKFLIILIATIGIGVSCDSAADKSNVVQTERVIKTLQYSSIVNYGSGVYYFPYVEAKFGNAIAAFLKNEKCELITVTPNGVGIPYGNDVGYFVFCRQSAER